MHKEVYGSVKLDHFDPNSYLFLAGFFIELLLAKQKCSFKNPNAFDTGLSDHHLLVCSMLKPSLQKNEPKLLVHRQKQPSRGVLRKKCSANMRHIYRRTPMPKCDFNKGAL